MNSQSSTHRNTAGTNVVQIRDEWHVSSASSPNVTLARFDTESEAMEYAQRVVGSQRQRRLESVDY